MPDPSGSHVVGGNLLVATAGLLDPNFEHTVVLVLDVEDGGALGVVLNRPSTVPVGEVLPEWDGLARAPGVLFHGGPVSPDSALAVGTAATELLGFRRLYDDVGIVDLDTPAPVVAPALGGLRIFAGYAGWGLEQLADEIHEGSWYVVPSEPGDLFSVEPHDLWKRVLRRQPGELAWVATRPADPTQN
jgi:putative transcriptional regulator